MSLENFYKLIRISLGESVHDFPIIDSSQWQELYTLARQQAIVGILYNSIEKLPLEKRPPRAILLKWIAEADRIRRRSEQLNNVVQKVETLLNDIGIQGCILKGQGIAQLYPNPELRTSGDIDVWINGSREDIISFVSKFSKSAHASYLHVDGFKLYGVSAEAHFTPSYMANPFANRRLQKWIQIEKENQFGHSINVSGNMIHTPTLGFNRVFILHHIYRHFFYEGIGFRQMMDFYYVLKRGFTKEEQEDTLHIYKSLNILNFAGAAVYVLHEIFGLEEEYFITPPNAKYGRVLLSEIITGGNFGQVVYIDKRREAKLERGWRIIKRSLRFIKYEPLEVLWIPYFKVMNNLIYVKDYSRDM